MNNPKILLVEDEAVLAEIIQESLRSRGFDVVCADTLAAARMQYYTAPPDLIILDVMLPDGSGFDWAKQIRNVDTRDTYNISHLPLATAGCGAGFRKRGE